MDRVKRLIKKNRQSMPRAVLVDLDLTTWTNTVDGMTPPFLPDSRHPWPRVTDAKGNILTVSVEAAAIIRSLWDYGIPICACSRGKRREQYIDAAKQLVLDGRRITICGITSESRTPFPLHGKRRHNMWQISRGISCRERTTRI